MRKCLVQVSYTGEGLKGLLKENATERREATEQLIASLGGTIEAFHYAFGEDDLFVSANLPDNVTATASSFVVNASRAAKAKTIVPLTPKEIDQVTKKTIVYRPVGK
jgi:uncharacterized protein with GYD domain